MISQRRHFRYYLLLPALLAGNILHAQSTSLVKSPDGRLAVEFKLNAAQSPVYQIQLEGQPVLRESRLGLIRDDADFSQGLVLKGESKVTLVKDKYEMLTAKRRMNSYRANRKEFHLATVDGKKMDIIF